MKTLQLQLGYLGRELWAPLIVAVGLQNACRTVHETIMRFFTASGQACAQLLGSVANRVCMTLPAWHNTLNIVSTNLKILITHS
jgi:hypothetical protein